MPACSAAPYPRCGTRTTRAPCPSAISIDPSVDPLSATTTSPRNSPAANAAIALSTQIPSEFASFRQGMTTDTSKDSVEASDSTKDFAIVLNLGSAFASSASQDNTKLRYQRRRASIELTSRQIAENPVKR